MYLLSDNFTCCKLYKT